MKKTITIITMFLVFFLGYGQTAMNFNGIALDGTATEVINKFKAKNYTTIVQLGNFVVMKGSYGELKNVQLVIEKTNNGKIESVNVNLYKSDDFMASFEKFEEIQNKFEQDYNLTGRFEDGDMYYNTDNGVYKLYSSVSDGRIGLEITNNVQEDLSVEKPISTSKTSETNAHLKMGHNYLDCSSKEFIIRLIKDGFKLETYRYDSKQSLLHGNFYGFENAVLQIDENKYGKVSSVYIDLGKYETDFEVANAIQKADRRIRFDNEVNSVDDKRPIKQSISYHVNGGVVILSISSSRRISLTFFDYTNNSAK